MGLRGRRRRLRRQVRRCGRRRLRRRTRRGRPSVIVVFGLACAVAIRGRFFAVADCHRHGDCTVYSKRNPSDLFYRVRVSPGEIAKLKSVFRSVDIVRSASVDVVRIVRRVSDWSTRRRKGGGASDRRSSEESSQKPLRLSFQSQLPTRRALVSGSPAKDELGPVHTCQRAKFLFSKATYIYIRSGSIQQSVVYSSRRGVGKTLHVLYSTEVGG